MNFRNNNPLDFLVSRQAQQSDRTKSPRRVNNQHYNTQPQYQHQYDLYPVNNYNTNNQNNPGIRIQTERTMSPNKLLAKGKPLFSPRERVPFSNTSNFNNNQMYVAPMAPMIQSSRYNNGNGNGNNYPYHVPHQHQNYNNASKQQANFKSPRTQSNVQNSAQPCKNHRDRMAEFRIEISQQNQYFCKMCAARLAAQGFQVIRLSNQSGNNRTKKNSKGLKFKKIQIPNFPQYQGNAIYETIIQFLKQVQTVQTYHIQNFQKFQSIQEHYNNQIKLAEQFYDNLKQILQNMRNDHLQDLTEFKLKHTQEADIYLNDLKDSMIRLDEIANDTIINIQNIVTGLQHPSPSQEETFWNYLKQNKNMVKMAKHQVQNQRDMFKDVPDYTEQKLQKMVKEYQTMLTSLWQQEQSSQLNNQIHNQENHYKKNSQPMQMHLNVPQKQSYHHNEKKGGLNIKQIHNNLPKSTHNLHRQFQGKGACRAIFDDNQNCEQSQQNLQDKVSPKFKVI